jgi:hypothetical protein
LPPLGSTERECMMANAKGQLTGHSSGPSPAAAVRRQTNEEGR